jgi:integrase
MAIPSKRKRGQAKAKQLFQRTEDLEEVIARAKIIKKRTLERGKVSLYLFIAGPEGAPYTMSGFQSKMRRTKERVAMKRLAAAGVEKPTKEQLLEAVRSIDIHFHDGRARAGADAEKSGQHPARFLGHTDDGQTARRHYLNRGVTVLQPNPRIKGAR